MWVEGWLIVIIGILLGCFCNNEKGGGVLWLSYVCFCLEVDVDFVEIGGWEWWWSDIKFDLIDIL